MRQDAKDAHWLKNKVYGSSLFEEVVGKEPSKKAMENGHSKIPIEALFR